MEIITGILLVVFLMPGLSPEQKMINAAKHDCGKENYYLVDGEYKVYNFQSGNVENLNYFCKNNLALYPNVKTKVE